MILDCLKNTDVPEDIQEFWCKRYGSNLVINYTELGIVIWKDHPRITENMLAAGYPPNEKNISHVTVYFLNNQSYNAEKMQKVIKLIAFL